MRYSCIFLAESHPLFNITLLDNCDHIEEWVITKLTRLVILPYLASISVDV